MDRYEIGASHWTSWSRTGASARTTYFVNTCKPDCAHGRYQRQPARVRFFGIARCRGRDVFTNVLVTSLIGKRLFSGDFRSIGYLNSC